MVTRLPNRVTLFENRPFDEADGPVDNWQKTHRKLPAARISKQSPASIDAVFVGRYCDFKVITAGLRLECDGTTYDVASVVDPDGTRQWLEVSCSALA